MSDKEKIYRLRNPEFAAYQYEGTPALFVGKDGELNCPTWLKRAIDSRIVTIMPKRLIVENVDGQEASAELGDFIINPTFREETVLPKLEVCPASEFHGKFEPVAPNPELKPDLSSESF